MMETKNNNTVEKVPGRMQVRRRAGSSPAGVAGPEEAPSNAPPAHTSCLRPPPQIGLSLRVASRLKFCFIALHIKKELPQQFRGSDLSRLQKHDSDAANRDRRLASSRRNAGGKWGHPLLL